MPAITLDEQIRCVGRELGLRRNVYHRFVSSKKLTQQQADHELDAIAAVYDTLKALKADPLTDAQPIEVWRSALRQCVRIAQAWHGDEAFDIYYNHSPEMKPIRELLGPMQAVGRIEGDA